jgi:hypothetical protein
MRRLITLIFTSDDEFFENAMLRVPTSQADNLIQLDPEVMAWFRSQGAEYRSLINSVLRRYMENSSGRQSVYNLLAPVVRRVSARSPEVIACSFQVCFGSSPLSLLAACKQRKHSEFS